MPTSMPRPHPRTIEAPKDRPYLITWTAYAAKFGVLPAFLKLRTERYWGIHDLAVTQTRRITELNVVDLAQMKIWRQEHHGLPCNLGRRCRCGTLADNTGRWAAWRITDCEPWTKWIYNEMNEQATAAHCRRIVSILSPDVSKRRRPDRQKEVIMATKPAKLCNRRQRLCGNS